MFKEYEAAETPPPVRRQGKPGAAMLAYRKSGLTLLGGPEAAPTVAFPAFPRRRERLPICRIAGASSP